MNGAAPFWPTSKLTRMGRGIARGAGLGPLRRVHDLVFAGLTVGHDRLFVWPR